MLAGYHKSRPSPPLTSQLDDEVRPIHTITMDDNGLSKENLLVARIVSDGGADGIRTHYLLTASRLHICYYQN
jgi:hypothetical protein